tara:strand:+ start:59 stop:1600 length:1542 start_codon:yes stop_codon:yes gene_type:complete
MSEERLETNKKSFMINVNYQVLMVLIQRISGFLINIVMVQLLTPQNFGLFSLFQRLAETTTSVYRLGLSASSQVLIAAPLEGKDKHDKGSLIGSALILNLVIIFLGTTFLIIFSDFVSEEIYQQSSIKPWLFCLILFCFFQAFENILEGIIKGFSAFKGLGLFNSYIAILFLFFIPLFTWFFSLKGAIYIVTFFQVLRTAFYLIFTFNNIRLARVRINLKNFSSSSFAHLKIALPFYVPTLVLAPVSIYLLSILTTEEGLESLAYLKILISLGMIVFSIPNAMTAVFISRFAEEKDYMDHKENLNYLFSLNLKLVWLFSMISSLILIAILPAIIGFLFGDEYQKVLEIAPYYLPTITIINLLNIFGSAFLARRHALSVMTINMVMGFCWILIGPYLISSFGLTGYLVAELLSYLLSFISAIILYRHFFVPLSDFYKSTLIITLIMAIIYVSVFYLNAIPEIAYRVLIFGSLCILLLALFWFFLINNRERIRMAYVLSEFRLKFRIFLENRKMS